MYDKEEDENDWDYLERKAPEVYHALDDIKDFVAVRRRLFDNGVFYWESNDLTDLTNKVMIGLLQLEIENLQEENEKLKTWIGDIEEKYRVAKEKENMWHFFGGEKDKVVFENGVGELAKVPLDLLDIIASRKSFDGKILSDASYVKYISGGTIVCRLPKALVNQLQKKEIDKLEEKGEEGRWLEK